MAVFYKASRVDGTDFYVVEIEWSDPDLPPLVGPFTSRAEADEWGKLNIVNGTWNVAPIAWPYLQSGDQESQTWCADHGRACPYGCIR